MAVNNGRFTAVNPGGSSHSAMKCDAVAKAKSSGKAAVSAPVRAGAYDSGLRVQCGAKRHRDGQPCQAKSEPGKRRCRFHGGRSTGPKTPEGKARALANLRQYREPARR